MPPPDVDRPLRAIIPAAGRATRFGQLQKCLQPLGDGIVLDHSIELAHALTLDVTVAVPTGQTDNFRAHVRGAERVSWIECEAGLGQCRTIQLLLRHLAPIIGPVLVVFGDDVSPVREAVRVAEPVSVGGAWAAQCVVWEDDASVLGDACRVEIADTRMVSVTEKPEKPVAGWRGCAVYGLSAGAALELLSGQCDGDDVLASHYNCWIDERRSVRAAALTWNVNVNRPSDLERARSRVLSK